MLKPLADRVLVKVEEEETKTMGWYSAARYSTEEVPEGRSCCCRFRQND